MTGRRDSFGSATWQRCVANDPNIVPGNAVGVALMIGAKAIRWPVWEAQIPTVTISERFGTTPEYVRDVITLLVHLGYLVNTGEVIRGRPVYTPSLPPQFLNDRSYREYDQAQPMNGNNHDDTATG